MSNFEFWRRKWRLACFCCLRKATLHPSARLFFTSNEVCKESLLIKCSDRSMPPSLEERISPISKLPITADPSPTTHSPLKSKRSEQVGSKKVVYAALPLGPPYVTALPLRSLGATYDNPRHWATRLKGACLWWGPSHWGRVWVMKVTAALQVKGHWSLPPKVFIVLHFCAVVL